MRTTATSRIGASRSPATASTSARWMLGSSASIVVTAASARASAHKVRWIWSPDSGESPSGPESTASPLHPPSTGISSSSGRRWPTTAASACHRAKCAPSTPPRARSDGRFTRSPRTFKPAAPIPGHASLWTTRMGSYSCRQEARAPTTSAVCGRATTTTRTRSWRSVPLPVRSRGHFRRFITICGTTTWPRRRCSTPGRVAPRWRWDRRRATSFSSTG